MKQSRLARSVGMSETLAIDEKVRALQASGVRVWSFGAGQPDAPTPLVAQEAGIAAIRGGRTRYTSPGGTKELREAICRKLARENGLAYEPDEILVAAGAKQAIFMALAVVIDPDDEVLVPAPYWVSYPSQIRMLGGTARIVSTDESTGFKLTAEMLRAAITPSCRAILLNSPCNPTGAVYSPGELASVVEVALEHDLYIISDEIYERILFGDARHVSPAALSSAARAKTAVINGASKAYSMTGWRIGYMAAPREWVAKATEIQSHFCGNPCSISQDAALAALDGASAEVAQMVESFRQRRTLVLEMLHTAPRIRLCPPEGAFYAFPDVSGYFGSSHRGTRIDNDVDLAGYLLEEAHAAFVPGSGFGSNRHLRLSFACAEDVIEEGLGSTIRALEKLSS
jgi:aspartate aminotransferase